MKDSFPARIASKYYEWAVASVPRNQ